MSRRRLVRRAKRFIIRAFLVAKAKVIRWVLGVYNHAEAIVILVLAALGLNALIGEIPFLFMLPLWVEATMVIPVLSVLIISCLVKFMEWRAIRRDNKAVLA